MTRSLLEVFRSYPGGFRALATDSRVPVRTLYRYAEAGRGTIPWATLRKIAGAKGWDGSEVLIAGDDVGAAMSRTRQLVDLFGATLEQLGRRRRVSQLRLDQHREPAKNRKRSRRRSSKTARKVRNATP